MFMLSMLALVYAQTDETQDDAKTESDASEIPDTQDTGTVGVEAPVVQDAISPAAIESTVASMATQMPKQSLWKPYLQSVGITAISMPITYVTGAMLTHTSNQLVAGLLPTVLTSVMIPSSAAYFSEKYFLSSMDYHTANWAYGSTIGLNVGLYAGGTVLGVSTDNWKDLVVYGVVSAVVLPVPTLLSGKTSSGSISMNVYPTESGQWFWSGGYHGQF